jgi:acetate---CoA ligase (ADP-forming)
VSQASRGALRGPDTRAVLYGPASVAVVGASGDPAKWGHRLARGALEGSHRRSVHLVNARGGEILGQPVRRRLADLPEPPELVVAATPGDRLAEVVDEGLALGTRAFIGIAGVDRHSLGRQALGRLVERVRVHGALLLGPNCMGVHDAPAELHLTWGPVRRGPLALVSQSGNLAIELDAIAGDMGLGFSRLVSLGDQAQLTAADCLDDLLHHDATRVVGVYLEDFRDGRAFVAAAGGLVAAGKPVVLLAVGAGNASRRAARSHTGALASDTRIVDAACRTAGVVRVQTPAELVDAAQALATPRRAGGRRIGVVGDGGGRGAAAAELAERYGLVGPPLRATTGRALAALLPRPGATRNPIDLVGVGEGSLDVYADVVAGTLASDEVDAVVLTGYFGAYGRLSADLDRAEVRVAERMVGAVHATGRPLVVHTLAWQGRAVDVLRAGGIACYPRIEAAVRGVAALAAADRRRRPVVRQRATRPKPAGADDYWEARALLADAGVEFADARRAETLEEALGAAAALGYPVACKATGLAHKSDHGGVALTLGDPAQLNAAVERLRARVDPPAFSIEQMVDTSNGVELLVGTRRDDRFGPVVAVGFGGVLAEVLADTTLAPAPVTRKDAERLLRSLRGAALLRGFRGRPPVDLPAAARVVAAVSRVALARPDLAEIEVNPLLVTPRGAVGLDARLVRGGRAG